MESYNESGSNNSMVKNHSQDLKDLNPSDKIELNRVKRHPSSQEFRSKFDVIVGVPARVKMVSELDKAREARIADHFRGGDAGSQEQLDPSSESISSAQSQPQLE